MTTYQAKALTLAEAMELDPDRFDNQDGEIYPNIDSDASGNSDWSDDPCEEDSPFLAILNEDGTCKFLFGYAWGML